jgi:hypothetical protein
MFNVSVAQTLKTNSRSHTPLRPQTPAPTPTRPHFTKSAPPHTNQPAHANSAAALCCLMWVGPAASFASSALLPLFYLFCCTAPLSFLVFALPPAFLSPRLVRVPGPTKAPLRQPSSCLYDLLFCFCPFPLVGGRPLTVLWCCPCVPFLQQNASKCVLSVRSSLVSCKHPLTIASPRMRSRARLVFHPRALRSESPKETKQACRACRSSSRH